MSKRGPGHCLFEIRFYNPVNSLGSCLAWSFNLLTLFLGGHSPLNS